MSLVLSEGQYLRRYRSVVIGGTALTLGLCANASLAGPLQFWAPAWMSADDFLDKAPPQFVEGEISAPLIRGESGVELAKASQATRAASALMRVQPLSRDEKAPDPVTINWVELETASVPPTVPPTVPATSGPILLTNDSVEEPATDQIPEDEAEETEAAIIVADVVSETPGVVPDLPEDTPQEAEAVVNFSQDVLEATELVAATPEQDTPPAVEPNIRAAGAGMVQAPTVTAFSARNITAAEIFPGYLPREAWSEPAAMVEVPPVNDVRPILSSAASASPSSESQIAANGSTRRFMVSSPLARFFNSSAEAGVDEVPLPVIRRQETLIDGDVAQLQIALNVSPVATTRPDRKVTDYLYNPPATEGHVLSLSDVLLYTLKNSPDIGIARFQADDAAFAVRAAKVPFRPTINVSAGSGLEGVYLEGDPRVSLLQRSEAAIRVNHRLFDFGRSRQALRRAEALHQSQKLSRRNVVEDTVFEAITAYLDLLGANQLADSSRQNVEAHERIVALVQRSFDAGNLSEAELKRARTRLDRARTNEIDIENRRERAIGNFRRVTGLEPGTLTEPLFRINDAYALTPDTIDKYLNQNPAVQAVVRDINSLEHQIKAASRAHLPEVNVELVGAYRENVLGEDSWASDSRAMVAATWQAYDGGAAAARKGQLISRKRENEQALRQLRNDLKQDAYNVISVLRTSQNKRDIFADQVEASARVVTLYEKQFDAGRRTLLELLDSQADLSTAREESIATKYENISAAFGSLRVQNRLLETMTTDFGLPKSEAWAQLH